MTARPDNSKESTHTLYRRLLWEIHSFWYLLAIALAGSILYSSCDAYAMYLIKPLVNKGFINGGSYMLKKLAFLFLILFLLRGIGSLLSYYFMGKLGANLVYLFRKRMFSKFLVLPASYYDKTSSGKLLSKFLYNIDQVTNVTGSTIVTLVQDGAFVIGLTVVMVITSWQLSIAIIISTPFLLIVIKLISKYFRDNSRNIQSAIGSLTQTVEETIINYKEIRVFGGQECQRKKFNYHLNYAYKQQLRNLLLASFSSPIIQFFGAVIITIILFIVATYGLSNTKWIDGGRFVAFFASVMAILKPIKNLMGVNTKIQRAIAATEDIFDIFDNQMEIDKGTVTITEIKGNIIFKNVYFGYPATKQEMLHNVSFEVNSGQTIAVVGPSGSGKSSLINLITRFYHPSSGVIKIDNINVTDLTLQNLRSHISLVSQHINLFNDTIYNNIAYGTKTLLTRERVLQAAEDAHMLEFIEKLPEGLNTVVGRNSFNLSGGQRQRLAIARAILKNACILILDEATSSLDTELERSLQKVLNRLMRNNSTFIITHHLATIENADKIIVMDNGRIVDIGIHETLITDVNGIYSRSRQQLMD